jgi:hypothetical protein
MEQGLGLVIAIVAIGALAAPAAADQTFTVPATASPDLTASCGTGPVDGGIDLAAAQSAVITGAGAATWDTNRGYLNGLVGTRRRSLDRMAGGRGVTSAA